MTEKAVNTRALSIFSAELIPTEKVRIDLEKRGIRLVQLEDVLDEVRAAEQAGEVDYISLVRGCLADCPGISVDKFMARKREEKER
ncbi:MAG: hypothetical protein FWG65_00820 [Turicibacter sp.]|nr:hypothetical protein [Turicibacter sp.]